LSSTILFVPGIKGSELYDGSNKRWFPATTKDVELLNIKNDLEPESVLRQVTPFGLTNFTQVIYQGLLDEFGHENLSIFPYDWRRSILVHVERLADRIINESKAIDGKVTVVAHSMGGMLSKLAIQRVYEMGEIKRLNKFITIGTPWHGSPDAYKSLLYGEPGVFEKLWVFFQFLSVEGTRKLARMFPSVYQLLPSETYFNNTEGNFVITDNEMGITYESFKTKIQNLHDSDKEETDHYDVWKHYIEPVHTAMGLELPEEISHDCLIGHSVPTLYKVPDNSKTGFLLKKYKQPSSFMNGDGVVPLHSATPSHKANLFFVEGEHSNLCSLPNVIDFIKWSSNNEEIITLPNGILHSENENIPVNQKLKAGIKARIMCPVESTILDDQGRYVAGVFDPSITEISKLAESEDVKFFNIGESKYIFFKERPKEDLSFEIHAYEEGIATVSLEVLDNNEETELKFDTIPVTREKSAKLVIPANKPVEESILRYESKNLSPKKRKSIDADKLKGVPIPKVKINFEPSEGVMKVPYRHTYSGPVYLNIESDDFENIDELFYSVDGKYIAKYGEEKPILNLTPGQHIIEVFGKDVFSRPIRPVNAKVYFDTVAPKTKLSLTVEPEGIFVSFNYLSNNSPVETHYRFINPDKEGEVVEWRITETNDKINVPARKLRENKKSSVVIEFFSRNTEFDFDEEVQKLEFSLGDIPMLMWEEFSSALTPNMIWDNVLPLGLLDLNEFHVSKLVQNKYYNIGNTDMIEDNVKSIKFESNTLTIEVFFSEKYSLYFSGPPTELLRLGQKYKFSFELRTERGNESITSTSPIAKIHAIKAKNLPNIIVPLTEKKGVFEGNFTVDGNFKHYKHKLVITDKKNTSPPLREIPLILSEDDQEE
jgi:pimeloyl-ACP methyl ester carboxylesterase